MLLIYVEGDSRDPNASLTWESIDNNIFKLDEQALTVGVFSRLLGPYF